MRKCECAMCDHGLISSEIEATHIGFFDDVHTDHPLPIALCTECSDEDHQDGASESIQPIVVYARGLASYLELFLGWAEGEDNEFST